MKHFFSLFIVIMLLNTASCTQNPTLEAIEWKRLATLPQENGTPSIGVAGAINAVYGSSFIVAGGANFPDKMPWEGGKKYYSDKIQILNKLNDKYSWNKELKAKLPEPIAYCGITSTPQGIVYAGGENNNGLSDKTFLIKISPSGNEVEISSLASLPAPLTNITLLSIGNTVYAIGGDGITSSSSKLLSLDLDKESGTWKELTQLPKALANTVAIAQESPDGTNIYVVGGRSKNPSGISTLHSSLYIYNVNKNTWTRGADISDGKQIINFSAGTGVPISNRYLLIMGGDNGLIFHRIETYLSEIANAGSAEQKAELTAAKNKLITGHKGFYNGILVYDTHQNTWSKIGELPFPAKVTTTAAKWGEEVILSNGEIKPGIRDPSIFLGTIK